MGCTHGAEIDRNRATANVSVDSAVIEAEKAVAYVLKGERSSSRIELSISCSHLKNKDKLGTSDPFYVAYLCDHEDEEFREIGRSEIIANTIRPQWINKVILTYNFKDLQRLRIDVFDVESAFKSNDSTTLDIDEQNFMGRCEVPVGTILGNDKLSWFGPLVDLRGGEKNGYVTIGGEELASISDKLSFRLECENIQNVSLLGVSDPFLIISKCRDDGSYVTCYKTEVMMSNLSPAYEIQSSVLEICNGDGQRPLKVEMYDWNSSGNHTFIGETACTLNSLRDSASRGDAGPPLMLVNPSDVNGKTTGMIHVKNVTISKHPSFLDYIRSGFQLQLMVAVDYTLSNGEPTSKNSLHAVDSEDFRVLNPYSKAIAAISEILGPYCGGVEKMRCPVFGFGGKVDHSGAPNHCFALNGNESDPFVVGVEGIVNSYYSALGKIAMSGPTIFAKVIDKAYDIAGSVANTSNGSQQYSVLLILTDGCIKDMDATIDSIVKASSISLSILIVGLGSNEDFSAMNELDSDNKLLENRHGMKALRDIVQFTDMSKLMKGNDESKFRGLLASSLLEELPGQVLSYLKIKNIMPGKKVEQTIDEAAVIGEENSLSSVSLSPTVMLSSQSYFEAKGNADQQVFQLGEPCLSSASVFSVESVVLGPDTIDMNMRNISMKYAEEEPQF